MVTPFIIRVVTRNTVNRAPHDQRRNDSPRNESRGISRQAGREETTSLSMQTSSTHGRSVKVNYDPGARSETCFPRGFEKPNNRRLGETIDRSIRPVYTRNTRFSLAMRNL